eukprot:CAMPEP_0119005684 /NCGR_PEP_ID=MMETSP1176-20130426/1867_1 /TAXON_ID=265551 /ORGANISM="Synedropsis recta cf, Strain CCMP1620" /LENGTH=374 /DNA_ID=CAMNT_0006957521 /DNA_START=6 /DNA_END=1127 /DNA_ORIENTATION=-
MRSPYGFFVMLCCLLSCCCLFSFTNAFAPPYRSIAVKPTTTAIASSFYGDFEDFENNDDDEDDDDDDEDDDDEYANLDDAAVANFRSRMGNMFGDAPTAEDDDGDGEAVPMEGVSTSSSSVDDLIRRATQKEAGAAETTDWANQVNDVQGGVVLVANPAKFCSDFGARRESPSSSLLNKFGLTLPPPADLGPDRRADLLPVLCVLEKHPLRGAQAVLLNRRTGYLLGDLEQQTDEEQGMPAPPPRLGAFMIQPLWFGGTSAGEDSSSSGLDMLHQCPTVAGTKQLTDDGLFWGGDAAQAQDAMSDPSLERVYTGFDFKFFVQSTRWLPLQLEKEIRDGTWFVASVSKEVLFKPRDRMGTRRAKPLWTEIMELMG